MRDDRGATMQLGDGAEADGKRQFDGLALAQAHVAGLDKHASGAQVARAAQTAVTARQEHVHGGARSVARCQSSFHGSASSLFMRCVGLLPRHYARAGSGGKRSGHVRRRYVYCSVSYAVNRPQIQAPMRSRQQDEQAISNSLPIGVFDSGVGGLTVLRALLDRLPGEDFAYLGDPAPLPYATKSPTSIRQ